MTTQQDVQARAEALLAPISDAAPGGENAQYDEAHEALRAEVGKLDSPTGGEVDWEKVARDGQDLLQTRSKDLLIANYVAYGLFENEKLGGLAVGLAMLDGLLDKYWETLFPPLKRKRGRGNALGWLVGRLEIALPALELTPGDRPALDLVIAGYKKLSATARDKLEDHAPGMRSVSDALTRMDMKIPKAEAKPEPAPEPAPPPPAPAAPEAAPTPPAPVAPEPAPAQAAPAPEPAPAAAAPAAAPAPEPPKPEEPPKKDPVADAKEAAKPWLEPLGDPPHGNDARYEEEYEQVRAEVGKLDSPSGDSEVQWDKVGRMAGQLLKEKSKDVLMASYLAYSQLHEKGVAELNVGLCVIIGIFENFENQWPKRPRGRGNALSWLTEQLERQLGTLELQAKDRETVEALGKVLREFGITVRDKLEDHAPSVRPVEDRVKRMLLAIPKPEKPKPPPPPKPEPKPAAAPAPAAAPKPAAKPAAPMPTAAADVSSADEVNKYLLDTGRAMAKAAGLLRRSQLSSPTAYRLMRQGAWLHLHKAPPSGPGGKTQIPPLPPPRRNQLNLIESNGKWAALLEETESAMMQFRFCLDLQRMSANALKSLGDEYEPARQALLGEVSALLRRMPQLPDLTAGDGSPLADDDTKSWIDEEVASSPGGGGGGGGAGPSDDPGEPFDKIGAMMKGGKGNEAMKLAMEAIAGTGSPRMRLIRRLALAQGCLDGGQAKLARSMFAALDREMSDNGLAEWEPRLASRCLEGLLRAARAAAQKGMKFDGADAALERLCLVDPAAAARLAT